MAGSSICRPLGALAIVVGASLLAWVGLELRDRRAVQDAARRALAGQLPPVEGTSAALPRPPQASRPAPGSVVGRILIPEADVDAVALEGIDEQLLKGAVGHFPGTALPGQRGNASFAAHRDSFFRGLRSVRIGQDIEVETLDAVHTYRVEETRVVDPDQLDVIDPRGGRHLTLITCYPFDFVGAAPRRFVVHAEWIDARGRDALSG